MIFIYYLYIITHKTFRKYNLYFLKKEFKTIKNKFLFFHERQVAKISNKYSRLELFDEQQQANSNGNLRATEG